MIVISSLAFGEPLKIAKAVRRRLGKSEAQFARTIGVSVATLQNWEQGRRRPDGPARALLKAAAENPEAVAAALAKQPSTPESFLESLAYSGLAGSGNRSTSWPVATSKSRRLAAVSTPSVLPSRAKNR